MLVCLFVCLIVRSCGIIHLKWNTEIATASNVCRVYLVIGVLVSHFYHHRYIVVVYDMMVGWLSHCLVTIGVDCGC